MRLAGRHGRGERRQGWRELVSDEEACQHFGDALRHVFLNSVAGWQDLHLELALHLRSVEKAQWKTVASNYLSCSY